MPQPSTPPSSAQPKISQKLILRTALFLFALAALFYGFRYLKDKNGDFNNGSSSTAGDIAAVQDADDGRKVVVIHPDGTITSTKSWAAGNTDRDPCWDPSGRFLFFSSDRDGQTYHIYRLNPDQQDAEQQTGDKRARNSMTFPADPTTDPESMCLTITGGYVGGFDPKTRATPQIIPPMSREITQGTSEDNQGMEALFEQMYGSLGTSFRYARYCKGGACIAAIMERDSGEILIIQKMTPDTSGKLPPPIPVIAGDHVDFDVNPKDGSIVYTVNNFRLPDMENVPKQFIKDNKIVMPYRHVVGIDDPDNNHMELVGASQDDQHAFEEPAISPDGASVLLVEGPYDSSANQVQPKQIITLPCKVSGMASRSPLVDSSAVDPTWSPDGKTIAFVLIGSGHRDVCTIDATGSNQKNLTNGKGDFSHPVFSPMTPTS